MPAEYSDKQLAFWEFVKECQKFDLDEGGSRKGVLCQRKQQRTTFTRDGQTASGKANFKCKICSGHKISEDILKTELRSQGYEFTFTGDHATKEALVALLENDLEDLDLGPTQPSTTSSIASSLPVSALIPQTPILPRTLTILPRGSVTPAESSSYKFDPSKPLGDRIDYLASADPRFNTLVDFVNLKLDALSNDVADLKSILAEKDRKIAQQDAKIAELQSLLHAKDCQVSALQSQFPPIQAQPITYASITTPKNGKQSRVSQSQQSVLTRGQQLLKESASIVAKSPRSDSNPKVKPARVSAVLKVEDTNVLSFQLKQSLQFRIIRLTLSRLGIDLSIIHSMSYGRHRTLNMIVQKSFSDELRNFIVKELGWRFIDPAVILKQEEAKEESIFRRRSIESKTLDFFLTQRSLHSFDPNIDSFVKNFCFDTAKTITNIPDVQLQTLWEKASTTIDQILSAKDSATPHPVPHPVSSLC
jgi:hypothetical protein